MSLQLASPVCPWQLNDVNPLYQNKYIRMSITKSKLQIDDTSRKRSLGSSPLRSSQRDDREIVPIYEVEEIATEEIMLPYASNEHIQFLHRNNSDFLRDRERSSKFNQPSPETPSPLDSYQFLHEQNKKQANRHPNLTRENLHEMNRKHRNIRTSHYKKSSKYPHAPQEVVIKLEDDLETDRPILTTREVRLSNEKIFTRKSIMSSYAQRAVNSIMRNSDEFEERSRAASTQEMRRQTSRALDCERMRGYEVRKHNPLVIYPFESKLKLKRVDDNPKILGSIIRKKFKQMEKDELYLYINGIVHRKDK